MKYPALCTVKVVFEFDNKWITEEKIVLLYADGYADAAQQIEEYYGDELDSMSITLFASGLLEFPIEELEKFRNIMKEYI